MRGSAPAPGGADTPEYDLFLSYNRSDREVVLQLCRLLELQEIRFFIDDKLAPGLPWIQQLERVLKRCRVVAVLIGPAGLGPWQEREKLWALSYQATQGAEQYPVIPVLLPGARLPENAGFLMLNTWVDLRDGLDHAGLGFSGIVNAVRNEALPQPTTQQCPYRGLRPFTESDALLFFGRRQQTEQLFQTVRTRSLVALVAPSGSGKSSLVQAGLAPLLRAQKPPETTWEIVIARPGDRPWRRVADGLMPLLEPASSLEERLERAAAIEKGLAGGGLPACVDRALESSGGADRLLVVLDQFEELFTLNTPDVRGPFLDEMMRCVKSTRMHLLLAVRGDYYAQVVASHRDLSDALGSRVISIGPMRQDELREAIERPAQRVGLSFEPRLAEEILDDVAAQPGNLPLLQFALTELWDARRERLLTHEGYLRCGQLKGAIANRAERIWGGLESDEQTATQRLFIRLVRLARPEEDAGDTRRREQRGALSAGEWAVAEKLASERLLVTDHQEEDATVEIAHEAIIRHWDRLRSWLDADREFYLWRQRLDAAIVEWDLASKDEECLLRGPLLVEAERWRDGRREFLSEDEKAFIEASAAVRERARQERLDRQRQFETEQAMRLEEQRQRAEERGRQVVRLRYLTIGLVVLTLGLAVATGVAISKAAVARSRALAVDARFYIASSTNDPSLLLFIALHAIRAADTREAREALHQAVQAVGKPAIESGGPITAIALTADGKILGAAGDDGSVQLRSEERFQRVQSNYTHPSRVNAMAFAPGISALVTAGGNTAMLWDLSAHGAPRPFPHACKDIMAVAFLRQDSRMVTGCNDGSLSLWDLNTATIVSQLSVGTQIRGIVPDPKSAQLAIALGDASVRLWDGAPGGGRILRGPKDMVEAVSFRPDGLHLAAAVKDGSAIIWEAASGRELRVLRAGPEALSSLAYSPDGQLLVTGDMAGKSIVWNARTGDRVITLEGPPGPAASVTAVAFDPAAPAAQPRVLVAGTAGIRIFDLDLERLRARARSLRTRPFTEADCEYVGKKGCELNP